MNSQHSVCVCGFFLFLNTSDIIVTEIWISEKLTIELAVSPVIYGPHYNQYQLFLLTTRTEKYVHENRFSLNLTVLTCSISECRRESDRRKQLTKLAEFSLVQLHWSTEDMNTHRTFLSVINCPWSFHSSQVIHQYLTFPRALTSVHTIKPNNVSHCSPVR